MWAQGAAAVEAPPPASERLPPARRWSAPIAAVEDRSSRRRRHAASPEPRRREPALRSGAIESLRYTARGRSRVGPSTAAARSSHPVAGCRARARARSRRQQQEWCLLCARAHGAGGARARAGARARRTVTAGVGETSAPAECSTFRPQLSIQTPSASSQVMRTVATALCVGSTSGTSQGVCSRGSLCVALVVSESRGQLRCRWAGYAARFGPDLSALGRTRPDFMRHRSELGRTPLNYKQRYRLSLARNWPRFARV